MLTAQRDDQGEIQPEQLEYYKEKLVKWRDELLGVSDTIMSEFKETNYRIADPVDSGSLHAEKELNLLTKKRYARLIGQIEHALLRIKTGEYGYCEITGERINDQRLEIMPLTTLSKEAQEEIERRNRISNI